MSLYSMIAVAIAASTSPIDASPPATVMPVDAALTRWDMAVARALAETMPQGADRCAVEGTIANRENRLDDAARLLPACLAELERVRSDRAFEAFETLVDTYRRRGDYGKEHALLVRWLDAHSDSIDADELPGLRNELGTAAVLRGLPRPEATGATTAAMRTYLNALGTRNVDLRVAGVNLPWMIDTGANYSVVSDSAARRMKLTVHDVSYHAVGSTGHSVATRIAVIQSLPVGEVILRNVVAIVVPDAALHIRSSRADYQIEATLGFPALAQLGQFRIDPDGTLTVDRTAPLLQSGARLYMQQLTPLVEVEVGGQQAVLSVDTGATRTTLNASYAARFVDRTDSWARTRDASYGMGGSSEAEALVEPELRTLASGQTVVQRDVTVALAGDKAAPVLGNLGQPFLTANGSYTFDFRAMRLLLGAGPSN